MNTKRGYYNIELGGKERTLHFSMNFWAELTDHLGISIQELGESFNNKLALSGIIFKLKSLTSHNKKLSPP